MLSSLFNYHLLVYFMHVTLSPATFRVPSAGSSGGIFDADFTHLFPDLPDSDKPETTLAMHQSPDGTMYWLAGQEGMLLKVGVGRYHPSVYRDL